MDYEDPFDFTQVECTCSPDCHPRECNGCKKIEKPFKVHVVSGDAICKKCTSRHSFCQGCGKTIRKHFSSFLCQSCSTKLTISQLKVPDKCFRCLEEKDECSLTIYNQRVCGDCRKKADPILRREHGRTKSSWCDDSHRRCHLIHKCCFCMDKRPFIPEGMYSGYIDGIGFAMNRKRWDFYCTVCKDYFEALSDRYLRDLGELEGTTLAESTVF